MKNPVVAASLILGVSLIVCTVIGGNAIISLGKNIERAGSTKVPHDIAFRLHGIPSNFNISPGNSSHWTIETISKDK